MLEPSKGKQASVDAQLNKSPYHMKTLRNLIIAGSLLCAAPALQAHTQAIAWEILPNGDVTFYAAIDHETVGPLPPIPTPLAFGDGDLIIAGVGQFPFQSLIQDVDPLTGLNGAIHNNLFDFDKGAGELNNLEPPTVNDYLVVTVSGLSRNVPYTISTTNGILGGLTTWEINGAGSASITVPDGGSTALMLSSVLGFLGLAKFRRNQA